MVKVTKIVKKSLQSKGEEDPEVSKSEKNPQTSSKKTTPGQVKPPEAKEEGPLLSKLGPYEEKKKVEKVEFSDKLGELFGVDPSDTNEKN